MIRPTRDAQIWQYVNLTERGKKTSLSFTMDNNTQAVLTTERSNEHPDKSTMRVACGNITVGIYDLEARVWFLRGFSTGSPYIDPLKFVLNYCNRQAIEFNAYFDQFVILRGGMRLWAAKKMGVEV